MRKARIVLSTGLYGSCTFRAMRARETWAVFALALAARVSVVVWAGGRFPPAGGWHYYDALARRLATGGYTWSGRTAR